MSDLSKEALALLDRSKSIIERQDAEVARAVGERDVARERVAALVEVLREIRRLVHSDHISDTKVVRFTERHLAAIDAVISLGDLRAGVAR